MTYEQTSNGNRSERRDAGIGDLFGSMLGFASASTKFTFQQMQNAMTMFRDPQSVMNRMRDSMDNISDAMCNTKEEMKSSAGTSSSEPQSAEDAIHGRKS
jgi:hypothetical protein